MNKISSILPSNARLSSVDMAKSSPIRAGSYSFGQAVAESSGRKALAKTTLSEASNAYEAQTESQLKERKGVGIVSGMADRFFAERLNPVEPKDIEKDSEPVITASSTKETESLMPKVESSEDAEPMLQTVGKNLSVVA